MSQACNECECCEGGADQCDGDKTCTNGCIEGFWGKKCTDYCPKTCKICTSYTECTECKAGFWGNQCNSKCGYGCLNNTCELSSGKCQCDSQNYGNKQCSYCKSGFYGNNCEIACPENCGSCISETFCSWCKNNRYYGDVCQFECSVGCYSRTCKKVDGACYNRCNSGFKGVKCDSCVPGKQRPNCDCPANCSICTSSNCTVCKEGYYPINSSELKLQICMLCSEKCKANECDPSKGSCTQGCESNTNYGHNCEYNCSSYCNSQRCDWKTGHCSNGCVSNHYGSFCDRECAFTCVAEEGKSKCNEINGHCISGCQDGFHGVTCDRKCSENCANLTCFQYTAECLHGCLEGYAGPFCTKESTPSLDKKNGHATGALIGAAFGTLLIGIPIGLGLAFGIIAWRRRKTHKEDEGQEMTEAGRENKVAQDVRNDNEVPVTYEDLRDRDERPYSQIQSYSNDYANC